MRVGLTVWNTRISPVADTATELLVARSDGSGWVAERRLPLGGDGQGRTVGRIAALELDVLVCGAVSRRFGALLEQSGVRVLPWVAGEWQDVLEALVNGELTPDRFVMAGCAGRRCCGPGDGLVDGRGGGGGGRRGGAGGGGGRGGGGGDGRGGRSDDGRDSRPGRGRRSGAGRGRGRGGGQ